LLPERCGGGGMTDSFTQALVQEELCFGCSGIGNLITTNGFFAKPVLVLGTEAQAERWGAPLRGERPPLTAPARPAAGGRGPPAFVGEKGDPGFTIGPPMRKMGQRALVSAELFFEDCFLPEDRRLRGG